MLRPPARRAAALAAVALAGAAPAAHAQSKPVTMGETPKPPAQPADPAAIEEARKHMKAGSAFYNDPSGHPKCEEGLREFTKAFELSGSLNARKGMALCNLELERDGDAIRDYTAYLEGKGASIDPAEKKQIEADLSALKAAVATVRISVNVPGARITDVRTPSKGFPIRNTYEIKGGELQLGVHPGQHVLTAGAEGFADEVWQVEIANGGAYARAFALRRLSTGAGAATAVVPPPPPPLARPVPAAVWVTLGLTGALGIAWGALAARAKVLHDDYTDANGRAPGPVLLSMRSDVSTANIVADVFLGAAVVSAATTAILYLTRPTRPRPAGLVLAPIAGPHGGGFALGGAF